MSNNRVSVFRKESFNAAHRLHNPAWDEATNNVVFGKCNNPNYHGHNYDLFVQVIGEVNVETGYVMDTKKLSDLIKEKVVERFDHKNLNEDCEEFKNINPTAENIVIVMHDLLRPFIEEKLELKLRLYETELNFVEYPV
ncbi:MAG: 6-carboxytetrahydropterin synthase [Ferruginibacter sp.]|nr:6-carboxytetrahydropterin synthase [Ferruginibacter sp.]